MGGVETGCEGNMGASKLGASKLAGGAWQLAAAWREGIQQGNVNRQAV